MIDMDDLRHDIGLAREFCVIKSAKDWPRIDNPDYGTSVKTVLYYWMFKFHIEFITISERRDLELILSSDNPDLDRANMLVKSIWNKIDNRVADHLRR